MIQEEKTVSPHTLNLSCTGRDALIQDWEMGAETAMVFAYRVFETENGFGVAGQTVCLDLATQEYTIVERPMRMIDGIETLMAAVKWMRQDACVKWTLMSYEYRRQQGITVFEGLVEDEVSHE